VRVAIDTSALLQRYLPGKARNFVINEMANASECVATGLVKTEVLLALHHGATSLSHYESVSSVFRSEWESFYVVPIDSMSLNLAAQFGSRFGLPLVDSIHLAALDRIPRPCKYLTFNSGQVTAAMELNFEVVEIDIS
tara:strand:- start:43 stop:456 length:414 start_codon:yes stop_codon:yes gene_type:complete